MVGHCAWRDNDYHSFVALRVLIVEDALIVREGLVRLVTGLGHTVIGTAGTAPQGIATARRHRPDLVLMDIRLPPTHTDEGIRATLELRRASPARPVLVLSQHAEPAHVTTLLRDDPRALGYLLKDRVLDTETLAGALDRVAASGTIVDPDLVGTLVGRPRGTGPLDRLTGRERETLALMAEGLTDRGIAARLGVSVTTVGTHVRAVFHKLDLPDGVTDNRRVLAVLTYLDRR
jgi:DNA-binding NarL/FixJ family response regulator